MKRILTIAAGALALAPPGASAVPPPNDNYLSPVNINARGAPISRDKLRDLQDSTEATTQPDLFSPPLAGGGPEPTVCTLNNQSHFYGKTIWYDFHPDVNGLAKVNTAGFDTVISVYEYSFQTGLLVRREGCADQAGLSDELVVAVVGGRSYSIQVGGFVDASGAVAAGPIDTNFQFSPDRDADGTIDALDRCPRQPGTSDGCPARLQSTPKLRAVPTRNGIRVRSLSVLAPRGSRVAVRCRRGCSFRQTRAARTVGFSGLRGRSLRRGSIIEIRVTRAQNIGNYYRYTVTRGNFKRIERCLNPGSNTPRPCR